MPERLLSVGRTVRLCTLLALVWISLGSAPVAARPPSLAPLTAEKALAWQSDLDVLAAELPRKHKDLYYRMDRSAFDVAVRDLRQRIPTMARHEVIVELARIVALVQDGHTAISGLLYGSPAQFRYLPIAMYLFGDGLHVYAADPAHRELVGGRVLQIGKADAAEAIRAVTPLVSRDNEMAVKERAPLFLATPEVLHALKLIDDMEAIPIVVEVGGRTVRSTLKPEKESRPTNDNWALGQRFSKLPAWIDAKPQSIATPLWLRRPQEYFWSAYLPEHRTLYAQFNDVANKVDKDVATWVGELQREMSSRTVERFILDLRWNTGGNNYLNKPLLLALIKARVNRPGGLYALIGRRNFSAAQNLINDLDSYTEVIFVGEPSASTPNFFGDTVGIKLPNSGLVVRASTLWWQDADPRDKRQWTGPDLAVELSSAAYRSGQDPVLRTALDHRPAPALADRMMKLFDEGDRDGAIRLHEQFKEDPLNRFAETERSVNSLGYRLLSSGRVEDSIAVFTLNVKAYPTSPNVYDSLAEAYLQSGNRPKAIENYKKVLELDPGNANATEAIKRILAQP